MSFTSYIMVNDDRRYKENIYAYIIVIFDGKREYE